LLENRDSKIFLWEQMLATLWTENTIGSSSRHWIAEV
jgi:hypothetical protein